MAFDLKRHRALIKLGLQIFEDKKFFQLIFYGDKDIFRFIFLIAGIPFHFVTERLGLSVLVSQNSASRTSGSDRVTDSLVHFFDDYSGTKDKQERDFPLFFHQLKQRSSKAFQYFIRIPLEIENSSFCFDREKRKQTALELIPNGEKLKELAESVFGISDQFFKKKLLYY
jgi:hypothetical protein